MNYSINYEKKEIEIEGNKVPLDDFIKAQIELTSDLSVLIKNSKTIVETVGLSDVNINDESNFSSMFLVKKLGSIATKLAHPSILRELKNSVLNIIPLFDKYKHLA